MKFKFKKQQYQTNAVESVADCFAGQPKNTGIQYRIDPGRVAAGTPQQREMYEEGFKNPDIALPAAINWLISVKSSCGISGVVMFL